MKWFTELSLGSKNHYEHTTICEQSHHIAYDLMTGHKNEPHETRPGQGPVCYSGNRGFFANFSLVTMAEKVTTGKLNRGLKTAVVDARLSNDAGKADWWLPVQPNGHGALAMAMIRWILENNRYDQRYLENANKAAAKADDEPTWTNASHLVPRKKDTLMALLKADEAGIGTAEQRVVLRAGRLIAVDPEDEKETDRRRSPGQDPGERPIRKERLSTPDRTGTWPAL